MSLTRSWCVGWLSPPGVILAHISVRHAPHGSKQLDTWYTCPHYTYLPPTAGGVKSVCVTQFPAASENKAQTLCGSDTGHVHQRYRGTTCPQACSRVEDDELERTSSGKQSHNAIPAKHTR